MRHALVETRVNPAVPLHAENDLTERGRGKRRKRAAIRG